MIEFVEASKTMIEMFVGVDYVGELNRRHSIIWRLSSCLESDYNCGEHYIEIGQKLNELNGVEND